MRHSRSVVVFLLVLSVGPCLSIPILNCPRNQADPKNNTLDSGMLLLQTANVPLPAERVLENLVRSNEERAKALLHSESTRMYHLVYQGFLGMRQAEMTVQAIYDRPSAKKFRLVSQSGCKVLLDRVLRKLLKTEQDAARADSSAQIQVNPANYDFVLLGYEPDDNGRYVFLVSPKWKSKYAYRGKVWIDGSDFAVTRIEGEPAQNPSFWTKRIDITVEYTKVSSFWLPARNESVSSIRLGGRATLTIDYKDYRLRESEACKGQNDSSFSESRP